MADNLLLAAITYFSGSREYSLYFLYCVLLYIPAWILLFKHKLYESFIAAAVVVNLLLFIFDSGILGAGREFVLYIPLIISYFAFLPRSYKIARLSGVALSIGILLLTTFSSYTPKLKLKIYEQLSEHMSFVATSNTFTALLAIIILLYYFIDSSDFIKSEHEKMNELLKESEFRLEFALDLTQDGFWDWDVRTNRVFFSKKWKSLLGYQEEELDNDFSTWLNILHPEDRAKALADLYAYVDGKSPYYCCVQRLQHKHGHYLWIEDRGAISQRDENGHPVRMIGVHTDITEAIKSERALAKTEQMLTSFNENLSEGIYRSTPDKGLVYVNKAFAKLFGFSSVAEALKVSSSDLYQYPSQRASLVQLINSHHRFSSQEVLFRRTDGTNFWGLISSSMVKDQEGNIYFDGAIHDITYLKEAEKKMVETKESLEKALDAKKTFLSTISHEMRTPLNGINGIVEYLKKSVHLTKEQEALDGLLFSVQHLNSLLTNMMNFAFDEHQHVSATKREEKTALTAYFTTLISTFNKEAQEKNIEIKLFADDQLHSAIVMDIVGLSQVFNNLIVNALKFTEEGFIWITYTLQEQTDREVKIRFSVKDTGIGIPTEKQELIFETFTQADSSIKRKYGGTGLGLAICKQILKKYNTDIFVNSAPGLGSDFYFDIILPKADAPERKQNHTKIHALNGNNISLPQAAAKQNIRRGIEKVVVQPNQETGYVDVLIVDDHPVNVFVLTQHMKLSGFSYLSANSGADCLDLLNKWAPAIVFLDVHMPGMDGIETCRRIKAIYPDMLVLGLTADTSESTRKSALDAGMSVVFYKPFRSSEITNYVMAHVNKNLPITA